MIYITTCKSSKDRLSNLVKEIESKSEKYEVIDNFDLSWIESWNFLFNISKDVDSSDQCKDLSNGEVGCYLAHIEALRKFLISGEKFCLIFEDDVDLPNYWLDIYKKALNRCINENISYCCLGDWGDFEKNIPVNLVMKTYKYTRCAHAYIIDRKLAKICYNKRFPICRPYDYYLNNIFKSIGMHSALYLDPGFGQKSYKSIIKDNVVDVEYKTIF